MPLAELIQNLIHKLESSAASRVLRTTSLILAVVALALLYDLRAWRNLSVPEGMDAAQLARNLADGQGYTTEFIRPFSLYLVKKFDQKRHLTFSTNAVPDYARVNTPHPDLANAPVYPVLLAGLMKVLPFHYAVELKKSFWSNNSKFQRYEPDFLITLFNQVLLMAAVILTFLIARKLFDPLVAWLSAAVTLGCELLWRFSASGLSTMLLLVIFLGLTWCLLKIEELARDPQPREAQLLGWVVAAGVLTGVGALTRYAFGWAIIPVALFLALFSGRRRVLHALVALGAVAVALTPWILRNYAISGTPFGTAGYALTEGTYMFPRFRLERSVQPDMAYAFMLNPLYHKLLDNLRDIFQNVLPRLGGSWASMLFLTGLLLGFRNAAVRRMRYFLLLCLGVFAIVQSLGQTQLAVESPEVNSENLLVLLAPLVFIYGVSLFFTLLDQMTLPLIQLRYAIIAGFVLLSCLPMIFVLMFAKTNPVAYPPYYPPDIQQTAGWMDQDELMMSDVPWAVAWYGNRQCVWLTLNAKDDFYAINDYMKPVLALYLTPETMDGRLNSDLIGPREFSWGGFILQVLTKDQIPPQFPLRAAPTGFLPERLFLTDRARWKFTSP
jgi:Dolichyl-phosphate-mannose-protein mannosyltransferase